MDTAFSYQLLAVSFFSRIPEFVDFPANHRQLLGALRIGFARARIHGLPKNSMKEAL